MIVIQHIEFQAGDANPWLVGAALLERRFRCLRYLHHDVSKKVLGPEARRKHLLGVAVQVRDNIDLHVSCR